MKSLFNSILITLLALTPAIPTYAMDTAGDKADMDTASDEARRGKKRNHSETKNFKCSQCDKRFNDRSNLRKHIRTHTGKQLFKCRECKKRFTTKYNLTTHIRIHTGEQPYKCTQCDKIFTQQGPLTKHMRTHTGNPTEANPVLPGLNKPPTVLALRPPSARAHHATKRQRSTALKSVAPLLPSRVLSPAAPSLVSLPSAPAPESTASASSSQAAVDSSLSEGQEPVELVVDTPLELPSTPRAPASPLDQDRDDDFHEEREQSSFRPLPSLLDFDNPPVENLVAPSPATDATIPMPIDTDKQNGSVSAPAPAISTYEKNHGQKHKLIVAATTKINKKDKRFKCKHPGCTKSFNNNINLKGHAENHNSSNPFPCLEPGCRERFKGKRGLANHKREHRSKKSVASDATVSSTSDIAPPCTSSSATSSLPAPATESTASSSAFTPVADHTHNGFAEPSTDHTEAMDSRFDANEENVDFEIPPFPKEDYEALFAPPAADSMPAEFFNGAPSMDEMNELNPFALPMATDAGDELTGYPKELN